MKPWHIALWLLLPLGWLKVEAQKNCPHTILPEQTTVNGANILPGDTVCLIGGNKEYLYLVQLEGTAEKPIVVINKDGEVKINTNHFYGIKFSHCKHVKLLGSGGSSNGYGIRVLKVSNGAGITVDELSTNIELAYIEVSNTSIGGIYAKTEPDCNFQSTRDKFVLTGLHIHHCHVHDVADEGMYIGSTKYSGQYLSACDTTVFPHLLNDVQIHDNIVERCGWDGIQLSSSQGACFIFNNIIRNDSYRETNNQMSGILIGGGSSCDCYNNQIFDGKGDGIDIFGFGEMKIYNNLIVRAGKSFKPNSASDPKHGIFVGNAPLNESGRFKIMHNTIISSKTTGIRFLNLFSSSNLLLNNIITKPGAYESSGQAAYFDFNGSASLFSIKQNIFSQEPESLGFLDYLNDNFDLAANSPAVNKAFDAGINNIPFDIFNRPRPHNHASDIGAFECQAINASLAANSEKKAGMRVLFNPVSKQLTVNVELNTADKIRFQLFDLGGKLIFASGFESVDIGIQQFTFPAAYIPSGLYFLHLSGKAHFFAERIIIP